MAWPWHHNVAMAWRSSHRSEKSGKDREESGVTHAARRTRASMGGWHQAKSRRRRGGKRRITRALAAHQPLRLPRVINTHAYQRISYSNARRDGAASAWAILLLAQRILPAGGCNNNMHAAALLARASTYRLRRRRVVSGGGRGRAGLPLVRHAPPSPLAVLQHRAVNR